MDDEHSAHKEQVNIAQQSDKDAVLEVIPSTSAKNQVRSFIIIYHTTSNAGMGMRVLGAFGASGS